MKREWLILGGLWAILTALMELAVWTLSMLPEQYAREAKIVDDAYVLLMAFGAPVFAFVVAMLLYSGFRYRIRGPTTADGPAITSNRWVVGIWLGLTGLLAATVLVFPGFTGLAELRADQSADIVIEVEGARWFWVLTYPNGGTTQDELVVPVNTRIRFDVTSVDILHSFWVPAFRTKIDAVPGRVTQLFVTPDRVGTIADDSNLRVQCAEFCGLGHDRMAIPVRVVPAAEFGTWMGGLLGQAHGGKEGA
ncbi:MAG: cytochrome c oxidase subunit II [Acidimicrobiia bacterium]